MADSPVLSRKSSVTDTYRLDHSEVLSDSDADEAVEEDVVEEADNDEDAPSVDAASDSSAPPILALYVG